MRSGARSPGNGKSERGKAPAGAPPPKATVEVITAAAKRWAERLRQSRDDRQGRDDRVEVGQERKALVCEGATEATQRHKRMRAASPCNSDGRASTFNNFFGEDSAAKKIKILVTAMN